ncbi:MAG: hypothetical protein WBD20_21475 [Pirellulaceae bacterium]
MDIFGSTLSPLNKRTGLTLIEVTISLILVSTILLVSITASANLMRNSNHANTASQAHELAGLLLDEISSQAFADSEANSIYGIEPDEDAANRMTFDDADDYDQYEQTPPTFRDGQAISGFDNWTISVSVTPASAQNSGITTTTNDADPLRLVTVTCKSPVLSQTGDSLTRRQSILMSATSENSNINDSYERMRKLDLTFSPDRKITIIAPLRNHPTPVAN